MAAAVDSAVAVASVEAEDPVAVSIIIPHIITIIIFTGRLFGGLALVSM